MLLVLSKSCSTQPTVASEASVCRFHDAVILFRVISNPTIGHPIVQHAPVEALREFDPPINEPSIAIEQFILCYLAFRCRSFLDLSLQHPVDIMKQYHVVFANDYLL
eukprot:GEZU01044018.1.p1 GENE.GEZU01044018.1~~GEZU01044018.1.p1  ORF type:complete len:107 (-),score=7.97 GEZU01044018.1:48-368(-)